MFTIKAKCDSCGKAIDLKVELATIQVQSHNPEEDCTEDKEVLLLHSKTCECKKFDYSPDSF